MKPSANPEGGSKREIAGGAVKARVHLSVLQGAEKKTESSLAASSKDLCPRTRGQRLHCSAH